MKFTKHILTVLRNAIAFGVAAMLCASVAHAQTPDLGLSFATATGLGTTDIRTTVARIISYFLGLLGIIAVGLVLYAGFLWMTAGGNEEKVSTAKRILTQAVIGLVIILSAFAIAQFVFGAIQQGTGISSVHGCPPGQVCVTGGLTGGSSGGFRIESIAPAYAGPNNGGWPKNYALTISFNATVAGASVTAANLDLRKCNSRLNGSTPAPFQLSACGAPIAAAYTVSGNRVMVQPKDASGQPTDFDADSWYKIFLQGGGVTDTAGRTLLCPIQLADVSTSAANNDYCERATAFNAIRDVTPPSVTVNGPSSPPAYCASKTTRTATVNAVASDDFLVVGVDYLLDGGTSNLVAADNSPLATSTNVNFDNPFNSTDVSVDLSQLTPGTHTVSAVAHDGVPQPSTTSSKTFTVVAPHCCNAVKDADETAVDCGGADCGACSGSSCTQNADCSSGYCNQTTHQCESRPSIDAVTPGDGGPGMLITIKGTGFGTTPGTVTFLGADDTGGKTATNDTDDKVAVTCAPQAWTDTQVTVVVPTGGISGPIKLLTAAGPSDRTDDTFGPTIADFTVNTKTAPGICYLAPSEGAVSTNFAINGTGFGATVGTSSAFMGSNTMTVVTCASGVTDCGWSDSKIWVTAPPITENVYPVTVFANGASSNPSSFVLHNDTTSSAPHVISVTPENGPVGSYVTIQGTGFGTRKGVVKFLNGPDSAIGDDPVCADNWHDTYIIAKVPTNYQGGLPLNVSPGGVAHGIQVTTSTPARSSNSDVTFGVNDGPILPGICSITPDNGPPGNAVVVSGEGFGSGPGDATKNPRFSLNFYKSNGTSCLIGGGACTTIGATCANGSVCVPDTVPSTGYAIWNGTMIGSIVAGQTVDHCSTHTAVLCADAGLPCPNAADGTCLADRSGWPKTGPVYVIANNQLSGNAVPFIVQDCNASGASCPTGQQCCANGSCQTSCVPVAKTSAYGWTFSTSVLPSLPIVVERAQCDATGTPPTMQSPSPSKNSTDACINAQLFFEFNRVLDTTSFDPTTVKLDECGSASSPDCSKPVAVPLQPFTTPGTFTACDTLNLTQCRMFQTQPDGSYNGGLFKKNTWYRVTLVSNPSASVGLHEAGPTGKYLDGDLDKRQGGDYVMTFKTRDSTDPCQISNVEVVPSEQLIQQDYDPVPFDAAILAGNCNLLQCGTGQPYAITWQSVLQYLTLVTTRRQGTGGGCSQPVIAKSETPPGAPTPLTASVSPIPSTGNPAKQGTAAVTIKFADPKVVSVEPTAGCTSACINASVGASFNVPMDPTTIDGTTVQMWRCRNATCAAPYAVDLGNGITYGITADQTGLAPDGFTPLYQHLTVKLSPPALLLPNTYYVVRILGGAGGVTSRSSVPLTGLNDGNYYTWKFQTKNDPTACTVSRTDLAPKTATLLYVGQRQDFTATAYGSPDTCSAGGQELQSSSYDWGWSFDAPTPNYVLQGFVNGHLPFIWPSSVNPGGVVNSSPIPKIGCTSRCLLAGSQNVLPQCGDGVVDSKYEACDDGAKNGTAGDPCTLNCLLRGNTAANGCGDHVVDATKGEECDMLPDPQNPGTYLWPPGCKQPDVHVDGFPDNIGCVMTGSSTVKGSTCGNGVIEDGEQCDDGNSANGDGCSADCLKEGSLPSCLDVPAGQPCTNVCGNGRAEPGEDPTCEPNPTANGCNPQTCLKLGVSQKGTAPGDCGDGIATEKGKECDDGPLNGTAADGCSDNCLLKGSSAFYASPSFCGDGIAGTGEAPYCEASVVPPASVDPYQVVAVNPQSGFDSQSNTANASTVKATAGNVADTNAGRANVTLSCTCKNEPAGSQDSYCANLNPSLNLACADNGCCMPRPTIDLYKPAGLTECRNVGVMLEFSEVMNEDSITSNFAVGYDNGTATCPSGTTEVTPLATAAGIPSFFQQLWNDAAKFIREVILRPALGAASPMPSSVPLERFCSVAGKVTMKTIGPPGSQKTELDFAPLRAFPANKYIRIRLSPGTKSALGVPLLDATGNGYTQYFGTQNDVCPVKSVRVTPASVLLASVTDSQVVTAEALALDNHVIVPTLDYRWDWSWDPVVSIGPGAVPVVLIPKTTNASVCSNGAACTNAAGCICNIGGTTCTIKNGDDNCAIVATLQTSDAVLRVRGSKSTDTPSGYVPKNSAGAIPLNAVANIINANGTTTTRYGSQDTTPPTGEVTVMLCQNPWPQYQVCDSNSHTATLPWDPSNPVSCASDVWYPFYDAYTNVEFSYCRDLTTTKPSAMAKSPRILARRTTGPVPPESGLLAAATNLGTLPCLKETPATVITPAAGILREYLFTFETNPANCPLANGWAQPTGSWQNDAMGLRISTNETHQSIANWYFNKGFRGSPSAATIDGYDALTEGRTAYVNAASEANDGSIYTNVDVLSYSDGAQPETKTIYDQIVGDVNFNRTEDLLNAGICRQGPKRVDAFGNAVPALTCDTDNDCRIDSSGAPVPGREQYTCDVVHGTCNTGATPPVPAPDAGISVPCDTDTDCLVDPTGKRIPNRPSTYACDAPKSKLRRDVRRWSDLLTLRDTLLSSANTGSGFPALAAGTFLRAQTNSVWPSWTDALGKALGGGVLPADPINSLGPDLPTTPTFDSKTGWDATDRLYVCPAQSHIYDYRSIGGTDFELRNDFEYRTVSGGAATWKGTNCPELTDPASCANNSLCAWSGGSCNFKVGKILIGSGSNPFTTANCAGQTVGAGTGRCGDGIVQTNETCEIGQTRSVSGCNSNPSFPPNRAGTSVQMCNSTCNGWVNVGKCSDNSTNPGVTCTADTDCQGAGAACISDPSNSGFVCSNKPSTSCTSDSQCPTGGVCGNACIGGGCGDGVVQSPPEKCDDGPLNGTYGHCNATCSGYSFSCGDGQKQPNEACDCASQNGQYHFNGVTASSAQSGNCPAESGSPSANAPSCSWDCSGAGPRCGDGIVNGPNEQCDGGFQEFKGYCNDSKQTGCNDSSACPSLGGKCAQICVTNTHGTFCTIARYCSGDQSVACNSDSDCVPTCGHFCQTVEQKERRSCNPNDPTTTADDAIACHWSGWSCTSPGSCGNGIKETGEECDTGLPDNNTGACIIDPTRTFNGCVGGTQPGAMCTRDSDCPGTGAKCQNIGYMCKKAYCGDGYVDIAAGEECDDGANNGRVCTPKYGQNCNYCNSSCRVVTVSGSFCGDNFVQDASWNPPGPEECDGTTGLNNNIICVSQKQEYQSFGLVTGYGGCSLKGCQYACLDPDSQPCTTNFGTNTDGEKCPTDGSVAADWCNAMKNIAPVQGSSKLSGIALPQGAPPQTLADSCDPDIDNDGVPNKDDCNPYDPSIHPAYTIQRSAAEGGPIYIAAPEQKCDGIDHDCSGAVNNVMDLTGKLIDSTTGQRLANSQLQFYCGPIGQHLIYETVDSDFSADGSFHVHHELTAQDKITCKGQTDLSWQVKYNDDLCGTHSGVLSGKYDDSQCFTWNFGTITVIKKPLPGQIRVTLSWSGPQSLSFHMFVKDGWHLWYGSGGGGTVDPTTGLPNPIASGTDNNFSPPAGPYILDNDTEHGNRPETITLNEAPGDMWYRFVVHKYPFTTDKYGNQIRDTNTLDNEDLHVHAYAVSTIAPYDCMESDWSSNNTQPTCKSNGQKCNRDSDCPSGDTCTNQNGVFYKGYTGTATDDLCVFQVNNAHRLNYAGHPDWPFYECPESPTTNALYINPGTEQFATPSVSEYTNPSNDPDSDGDGSKWDY